MQFQRYELIKNLPEHGWKLIEIEIPNREHWYRDWADEILTIESFWRPVGFRAVVIFLVDPMSKRERKKGEQVWAIRASSGEEYNDILMRKGHWEETLGEVFAELAKLRQRGLT